MGIAALDPSYGLKRFAAGRSSYEGASCSRSLG